MRTQLSNILELLLVKNNIRLHTEELKLQVSSHPSYPSLHALTGVLEHFNIPNIAIDLPITLEVLNELPDHFIAYIIDEGSGKLALVEQVNNQIKVTYDLGKSKQIDKETFLKIWNGIIVAIEKDSQIKEFSSSPIQQALKWFLISLSILSIGFLAYELNEVFARTHFLLSIVGLIFSVLIVRHELGIVSTIVNKFCNLSSASSCEATLSSKGAKLFHRFKLSDICLVTFSTYILYWLLFLGNNHFGFEAILIPTLLAIPITIYSIYYQYRVVKKWCPLCLGIAGVLWLQVGAFFGFEMITAVESIGWFSFFILLICGIVSIGVWNFLHPHLERIIALEKLEVDHLKFKREYSIFKTLLQKEKSLNPPAIPFSGEIVLGNKNAPVEMILVTSPACYFCKEAHSDLMKILDDAKDKVRIIIRFNIDINNKESKPYQITSTLLHIYNTQSTELSEMALEKVFEENADQDKWLKSNAALELGNYDATLQKQHDWCRENRINFTPAFFVNNKEFPREYNRTDLKYFINDLIEEKESNNTKKSELVVVG